MEFDPEVVRRNIEAAPTDDLMDRITFFRGAMEPWAVTLVEEELQRRQVSPAEIAAWVGDQDAYLWRAEGIALTCSFCRKPAVAEGWGWQKILRGLVPVFPRRVRYCRNHRPPD